MRYRSRPVEVEAIQWCRQACADVCYHSWPDHYFAEEIVDWVNANGGEARYESVLDPDTDNYSRRIAVRTINGWAYASPGHYVVMGEAEFPDRDVSPERFIRDFYPCDPEMFERRFEATS